MEIIAREMELIDTDVPTDSKVMVEIAHLHVFDTRDVV